MLSPIYLVISFPVLPEVRRRNVHKVGVRPTTEWCFGHTFRAAITYVDCDRRLIFWLSVLSAGFKPEQSLRSSSTIHKQFQSSADYQTSYYLHRLRPKTSFSIFGVEFGASPNLGVTPYYLVVQPLLGWEFIPTLSRDWHASLICGDILEYCTT